MTWPDFLQALRRYGFRASGTFGFTAFRSLTEENPELPYRIDWVLDRAPVRVYAGFLGGEADRPTVYEGTPEEVLKWVDETYPKMTTEAA